MAYTFDPVRQMAFADWMLALMPPPPANVLVLGCMDNAVRDTLQARGCRLTSLDWRNPAQQALPPAGAHGELLQVRLAAAALPAGQLFEAVLALDLAADIHPLALFDGLDRLLAPHGVAVLAGEGTPGQWLNDYAPAIALRCGFVLEDVAPCLLHLQSVPNATNLNNAATPGGASNPDNSDALPIPANAAKVRIARRSATPPRWRVGHVLPTDFAEVAVLFQEVFGHPLSPALWEWKYGAGRGNAVMARKDGRAVAHYGGMYRDILVAGRPERVAQICDVMVQSQERGVLTRQGPFFLMGTSWPEVYGPLGFGFPTRRAMGVAVKMGLYTQVGQMAEVRWQPLPPRPRLASRVRPLDAKNSADQAKVGPLWQAMAHDLQASAVGVRNWAFLQRRYFSHPHNHYEVLLVTARLTGMPMGIVVMRRLEASCELLDVIGPLASLPTLLVQARRKAARWGLPYVYTWITTRHAPQFVACGGTEQALDLSIPASSWTRNPQSDLFQDKWWLMPGDTDFR